MCTMDNCDELLREPICAGIFDVFEHFARLVFFMADFDELLPMAFRLVLARRHEKAEDKRYNSTSEQDKKYGDKKANSTQANSTKATR